MELSNRIEFMSFTEIKVDCLGEEFLYEEKGNLRPNI